MSKTAFVVHCQGPGRAVHCRGSALLLFAKYLIELSIATDPSWVFRFEDQGFPSSKPASPPDAAGRLIPPYPGGGAMTTIQVQPLTRKFPIVTLFVSGNPPVRRCLSTTLVHCQGPGRALHCQGVDNETPPAVPLNNSRPLPRTWGAVQCRGSAGVPICQGPGRVLDCRAKDLTKELPAMPLNTSRPLPRTWGSCPLPRISLCSSVPRIERACYSRACWRPGEWGCTPTPHAGELSIPA